MSVPLPLLAPLWLASASLGPSAIGPDEVDRVEVSWPQYQAMLKAAEVPAAPGPWAADREVTLRRVEDGWELEARWTLRAGTAGWIAQQLLGSGIELRSATLDGALAPTFTLGGSTMLAAWVDDPSGRGRALVVRGFIPQSGETLQVELMPATRGRLRAEAPGKVLVPLRDDDDAPPVLEGGLIWSGGPSLQLRLRAPSEAPPERKTLAIAHAGVGLTIGDAELRGRAHLQWELRHGSLSRVRASVDGLGEDLTVEGRDVATWSRNGNTLEVELNAPVYGRVDLDLRWSQAIPDRDEVRQALPRIEPEAWRSESSLQLARDGEIEVIPEVEQWTAIAAATLPDWGQGLVEGTPTAAYQRTGGAGDGHLGLLRFVPVPGPPTVVDVASYTLATTDEGRVLMKAYYELRNDRGSHLTVVPPPGLRIIGAQVAGETALPSRGDDNAWRIPLKRSLETVEGLLSFPVEVILLGEQEQWSRREERQLPMPTLDVPIAASRVTLHLPPRYRSRLTEGEHNVVEAFGQGEELTYGTGVGEVGSAVADAMFQEAVDGYLSNDISGAQAKLEELEQLGVSNENMVRLQSNIDVLEGKADAKDSADRTVARRVKEQAKARAVEEIRQQEVLIEEAEKSAQAGDYSQAEAQYQQAVELGDKLVKFEQAESVEQMAVNSGVAVKLKNIANKRKAKKAKKAKKKATLSTKFKKASKSQKTERKVEMMSGSDFAKRAEAAKSPAPTTPPDDPTIMSDTGIDLATQGDPTVLNRPVDAPPETKPEAPQQFAEPMQEPPPEPEPEPEPVPEPIYDDYDDAPTFQAEDSGRSRRRGRERRSRRVDYKKPPRRRLRTQFKRSNGLQVPNSTRGADRGPVEHEINGNRPMPTSVEPVPTADPEPALGPAGAKTGESPSFADEDFAEGGETLDILPGASVTNVERLPTPTVNASALSVFIPATGQTVRYEQLLIDANQTQFITIDARRRLRR